VSAKDISALQLSQLHEQLYNAATFAQKVYLSETWLRQRLQQALTPSPLIQPSLTLIAQTDGQLSMQTVADSLAVSTRQLERLYQTEVGLPPKRFARMMRVRKARAILKQNDFQTLADVAYAHGYYDQPHFIREFKSVVGMTPGDYSYHQQKKHKARLNQFLESKVNFQ
jgi:transcriptional regulator GlxA family with amidase domain